jgi:peptidoglycan/LPS O-acetylase OafA/YrhL
MTTTHPEASADTTLVSFRGEPTKPAPPDGEDVHSAVASSVSSFHVPSLDGMRGGAFLLVFFGHALPDAMLRFVPPAFGVTVFFVLSGYLITTLLRREVDKSGTVSFRDFYLRRALRILPPFYIVLVLSSILTQVNAIEGKVTLPAI